MVLGVMFVIIVLDVVLMLLVLKYGRQSNDIHVTPDTSRAVAAMRAMLQADEEQNEQEAQSQS